MNIATLPAGTPIYITAEDRFHNLQNGHGIVIEGTLYCTAADEAEAQRLYGRNQADTDSKGQWL